MFTIIYEGESLINSPSPIFYKRGALICEIYFPIRMPAWQTKQCGTVSIITTVFNKVQEIMKTAKKAISPKKVKSLAKERSLPKKKQSTCSRGHAFLMKPKNATRPSSTLWSIKTKRTEIQKTWLVLEPRTLFFLFKEKSWEKYS